MLECGASCEQIVRGLGGSPSMASFEVLEGGLLCGLSQRPRRTGSSERGRTGSSTNTEAENSAEVSPEASLLFPLPSFADVFRRVALAGRRSLHVPHDIVHSAVDLYELSCLGLS